MKRRAKGILVLILAIMLSFTCMPVFPVTSVYAASENSINAVWNEYTLEWDKISGVSHYEMWVNHKFAGDMNANTPITRHQVDFSETIDMMIANGDLARSDDNYYDIVVQARDGSENMVGQFADSLEYDAPQPEEGIENISLDGTVLSWDNLNGLYYRYILMIDGMSAGDCEYSGQEHYELDLAEIIDVWVANGWIAKNDSNMYEISLQATNEDYSKDTTWTDSIYYEPQDLPPLPEITNLVIDGNVLSWDEFVDEDGTKASYYEYFLSSDYYSEDESGIDGGFSTEETSVDLIRLVWPVWNNMLDLDRFTVTVRAYDDQYELMAESSLPMPASLENENRDMEFSLDEGLLSWDGVDGATEYVCYIDECPVYLPGDTRNADLNSLIDDLVRGGQIKSYQSNFEISLLAYEGLHVVANRYVGNYSYTSAEVQAMDIQELPNGNLTWQAPSKDTAMYVITGTFYGDGEEEQKASITIESEDNAVPVEFDPAELYYGMNHLYPDVEITVTAFDEGYSSSYPYSMVMKRAAVGTYRGVYSVNAGMLDVSMVEGQLFWPEYPDADYYTYKVSGDTTYSEDDREMYGWESVYSAATEECLVDLDAEITRNLLFWDSNYTSGQDTERTFHVVVTAYDADHKACACWKGDYDYSFEYGMISNIIAGDGYLEWDSYDGVGPLDHYECVIGDNSGNTITLSTAPMEDESGDTPWVFNVNENIDWHVYYGDFDKQTDPYSVTVYACTEDGKHLAEGTAEYDYSPSTPDLEALWSFGDYYIDKDKGECGTLYFQPCKSDILNSRIWQYHVYINDTMVDNFDVSDSEWIEVDVNDEINYYLEAGGEACADPSEYTLTIKAIYYREYPGIEMQVRELPVSLENAMLLYISDGYLSWEDVSGASYYTLEVDGDEYQDMTDDGWQQHRFASGSEGCSLDDILADYSYIEKTDHFVKVRAFDEDDNEIASGGKAYQTQLEYATIDGCWSDDDYFYWDSYRRYNCPCFYRLGVQDEDGHWLPLGVVRDNFKPRTDIEAQIDRAVWETQELNYQDSYTITVECMNHTANPLTEPAQFGYAYTPGISVDDAKVTLPHASMTYTGKALTQEPTVVITFNGETKTLTKGTDYTVSYKNNINVGTATVIITGKGNYKGTVTKNFQIKAVSRWVKESGNWYYYNASGVKATGWQKVGGVWYYMNSAGVMQTGWEKIGGRWYYFNSSGAMQTGWQKISGSWYYFNSSGSMGYSEWRDGYWLNANGTWTYQPKGSWKKSGGRWWFGDTSGWYAKSTTIWIDGSKYSFDASGWLK